MCFNFDDMVHQYVLMLTFHKNHMLSKGPVAANSVWLLHMYKNIILCYVM